MATMAILKRSSAVWMVVAESLDETSALRAVCDLEDQGFEALCIEAVGESISLFLETMNPKSWSRHMAELHGANLRAMLSVCS